MQNPYKPDLMEIIGVRQHTADVKSVRLRFQDAERAKEFDFRVGQFGIFSRKLGGAFGDPLFQFVARLAQRLLRLFL